MPQFAITGASGHLGFVIHKQLCRVGSDHRLMLRRPVDYIDHSEVVFGSLESAGDVRQLLADVPVVIHCAGAVWPKKGWNREVYRVNFELTKQLYAAAVDAGTDHFVFISSIHSMVVPEGPVFDERAGLVRQPTNVYDFSKAEAERYLAEASSPEGHPSVTIVNPTAIIGPGDFYLRGMNQLFHRLFNNRLPALTAGGFDVVDVRDVAAGIIRAAQTRQTGKYILGGSYRSIRELAELFGSVVDRPVTSRILGERWMRLLARLSVPFDRLSGSALPMNTYAVETLLEGHTNIVSAAAEHDLSYSTRPLEETMTGLARWFSTGELTL